MSVRGQWGRGIGHPPSLGPIPEIADFAGSLQLVGPTCYNLDGGNVAVANASGSDAFLRDEGGVTDSVEPEDGIVFDASGPADEVEPEDGLLGSFGAPISETLVVTNV